MTENGNRGESNRITDREGMFETGRDLLGPVIAHYLARLSAVSHHFESNLDAKVLYVARAGIRIRRALETFQKTSGCSGLEAASNFWISRLMAAKGTWSTSPDNALRTIAGEFTTQNLNAIMESMFREEGLPADFDPDDPVYAAPASDLAVFLSGGHAGARQLTRHLSTQSDLFTRYVDDCVGPRSRVLLVDTGWQGTAQRLLNDWRPSVEWWGAYFGRYGFANSDRRLWHQMIGVVFEQDTFDPSKPETCVVLNRHLIEDLFEPAGPSISRLDELEGTVVAPGSDAVLADAPTIETDPLFSGVMDYLATLPDGHSIAALTAKSRQCWQRIARLVAFPSADEAKLFAGVERSADFGKTERVPLLLPVADESSLDTADRRIRDSLWPTGQAALEYSSQIAKEIQTKMVGASPDDLERDPLPDEKVAKSSELESEPTVAVITRTMDRSFFLRRALESVAKQTFTDYVQVVVCDGGDIEKAKQTIEETACDKRRVVLIDNIVNRGMEAASNIGIRNCKSKYVVIHDDDDTWEPTFLEKTVEFLESDRGQKYGGVITKTTYVSEEVSRSQIKIHDRRPYQEWVQNVHIMEMAICNFFAPIAFLFRRSIGEEIGGYNESYPVLGDWDFNLRFLMKADIGMITEPLANYHHRDRGDVHTFGNTVIAGRDKHLEYEAIVRNNFVRSLLQSAEDNPSNAALATLVGMGLHFGDLQKTVRRMDSGPGAGASPGGAIAGGNIDSDDYWVALNQLMWAVSTRNIVFLSRIPSNGWLRRAFRALTGRKKTGAPKFLDTVRKLANTSGLINAPMEPPPNFNENRYMAENPDVADFVKRGVFASGYEHYVKFGRKEGRLRR